MAVSIDARAGQAEIDIAAARGAVGMGDKTGGDVVGGDANDMHQVDETSHSGSSIDASQSSAGNTAGIGYDFTPDKAKDRDEDSLIAYDQYKSDPIHKSGDPSRSVMVGSRQATKDQDDVIGSYVMAVTSGRTDQMGAMGTSWARANAARRQNRIDSVTPSLVAVSYTHLTLPTNREV